MEIDKPVDELSVDDLNRMYLEGEECDKRIFAEMRTNLQLVAGDHFVKEGSRFWNRIRDSKSLTDNQRLKLTKNHLQRITKIYRNSIENIAPDVEIVASNEKELKDQKAAELHKSYWEFEKERCDWDTLKSIWLKNFIEIGEVCVKVMWDLSSGSIVGYKAQLSEDGQGNMIVVHDEFGQPVPSEEPVFGGRLKLETFEAYNLRRDKAARTMAESPYLILSKLISKKALRGFIKDDETRKLLENSPTFEYTVYDNNTGFYKTERDQVLVKECYFRPNSAIINGYYYIYTDTAKIDAGELPYGIFPIIHEGFDEQTGNPRSHSVIRHCRPAQIEINRCASTIAETQITLGFDKLLAPANTKISQGAMLPGLRVATYSGVKPEFLEGRTGAQYLDYLNSQIDEIYKLANLDEVTQEQPDSQDMYANLLRSYRFRRKFSLYGEKFERFLRRVVKTSLALAKKSINENELVPILGKCEYINVPEFKSAEDIGYQIKVKARSGDVESQFGKQLTLNHILQYVGTSLDKEDIGQMLRLSPFLNEEQAFKKFTQKYDAVTNDILALDRGQYRPPRRFDDHEYIIKALTARMSESDFEYLPEPIRMLYEQKLRSHEELAAQRILELQRAQSGFIPSGGYLVAMDFYQPDPKDPAKTKRVRLPSESVDWLIKKLEAQGTYVNALEAAPGGVITDLNAMIGEGGVGVGGQNVTGQGSGAIARNFPG